MIPNSETPLSFTTSHWLDNARDTLARLPLAEQDAVLRTLIADWSRRHVDGERLRTNPAWEAFETFVREDRTEQEADGEN